ncbi:hypothetical protein B0H14DRAFT_2549919 [Mycena olivaceomarginata]|nr:hypothetical protein B0H14DRAFT_2549919 [Mycena olivaceomarginata]
MRKHRRRPFAAINVGLSYGKGQKTPCWLSNKEYSTLTDGLLRKPWDSLTAFLTATFGLWAPRLYSYYREHDSELRRNHPHLRRPFVGSIFSCAALQLWPNVWTFRHRDVLNLVFGWCAVQVLGRFDATKGGHLILWDLKLVVEFPHGAPHPPPFHNSCSLQRPCTAGLGAGLLHPVHGRGDFSLCGQWLAKPVEQLAEDNPEDTVG